MTPMVPIALIGWVPLSLWLFSKLEPTRAVIAIFALGWMFLPEYSYDLKGIPDYSKVSAISYSILLGTLIFNRNAFTKFKLNIIDYPIIVWCLVPIFTSLSNDLGLYDGLSTALNKVTQWGLPYYIGRTYFNDRKSLNELAFGIFLAGLIYMPFCWWEVVMSPQLHRIVYGWHPHDFIQAKRGGGFRPVVFMEHGLMVAMWTVMAFLSGYQLWRSKWFEQNFPKYSMFFSLSLIILFVTIIINKSTGAILLIILALLSLYLMKISRSYLPLLLLILLPITYTSLRSSNSWDGENLIHAARSIASVERAASLHFRLKNENILIDHAKTRIWLGWGGHQRSFVFDEYGRASVPDGLWILTLAQNGFVGLISLGCLLLLPGILFIRRFPSTSWDIDNVRSILTLPFILSLFILDSLMNAMFNPLVIIIAGGINGLLLNKKDWTSVVDEIKKFKILPGSRSSSIQTARLL